MDANGNGVLEPNEIPEDRKRMMAGIAGRLGLDVNKPVKLDDIGGLMERRSSPEHRSEQSSTKSAGDAEPLVPGCGVEQEALRVPAFGERVDYAALAASASVSRRSSSSSSPSSSSGSGPDAGRESRYRYFAQSMFRRYDKNGSGFLEKDEWGEVRNAEAADGNHDGRITPEELANQLAQYGRGRSGESGRGAPESSGSSGSSGTSTSKTASSDDRKSYRFRTPTERLPEGLPDWFARNDANGDGQVAMAEYAASWSDSKVREFDRYDLNRDGLITPRECLDAESDKVELADAGSATPSGGPDGGSMPGPARGPSGSPASGTPRPSGSSPPKASTDQGGAAPWWMQ
ncbi:MAG: hypothetical protein ABIP48_20215 [Planctomycetota bacterium]